MLSATKAGSDPKCQTSRKGKWSNGSSRQADRTGNQEGKASTEQYSIRINYSNKPFQRTEVCTSLSIITILQFFPSTNTPQNYTLGQLSEMETHVWSLKFSQATWRLEHSGSV